MLRKRLLKILDKKDGLNQIRLAKIAGVTEPTISRYLNGVEQLGFEPIRKIIKYLFSDSEKEYMAEFAYTQELQNARCCLEYSSINSMHDVTTHLIEKLSESNNRTDREWAKTYQYVHNITVLNHAPRDFIFELEQFLPKKEEMKILKTIAKCHALFHLDKHIDIFDLLQSISPDVEKLQNEFLKQSYMTRINVIMTYIYLYRNNISDARKASEFVINQDITENIKAGSYLNLGHSYFFEDYHTAKSYYDLALNAFLQRNRMDLVNATRYTVSFLQSYHRIERDYEASTLEEYQEKSDYIYYLIQKGDKIKAKELLEGIEVETIPDWNKGFYYYYLGLIENNKDPFYESVKWFRKTSNFYHLEMPIQSLRDLGENETVLEIFTSQ